MAAQKSGFFDAEIVPVTIPQKKGEPIVVAKDEHPRDTSLEALAKLKGVVRPDGTVTAGNASGVNDGACALLLADEAAASGTASRRERASSRWPPPACRRASWAWARRRRRARCSTLTGLTLGRLDVIELNEAFAAQGLAVLRDLGLADDDARVNPNGGAIALGHPLGASGARLATTAVNQLHRIERPLRAVHDVHRRRPGHRRHHREGLKETCMTDLPLASQR